MILKEFTITVTESSLKASQRQLDKDGDNLTQVCPVSQELKRKFRRAKVNMGYSIATLTYPKSVRRYECIAARTLTRASNINELQSVSAARVSVLLPHTLTFKLVS